MPQDLTPASGPLAPLPPSQWTRAHARHLLNRAGFGVPLSGVDVLARLSPEKAVGVFVDFEQYPEPQDKPDFLPEPVNFRDLMQRARTQTDEERRVQRQDMQRREREALDQLRTWWIERMQTTRQPLPEKMALFWHGHFATSSEKVRQAAFNYAMYETLRQHGLGNFRALLGAVSQSPAMLRYLDNIQNRKGRPNENFARELMELFTMGIGNYTEQDVKEAARAFTGWTLENDRFVFNRRQHDEGQKTVLGQTGNFDGNDILDIVARHNGTTHFITRKIWDFFAYPNPSDDLVHQLSHVFHQGRLELRPFLRTVFLSREFYSERAMGMQVKSPVQFLVQLRHHLGLEQPLDKNSAAPVRLALRAMGQELFTPPNVKGWEGNRAWINTNTLLMRYNIPAYMVNGERPDLRRALELDEVDDGRLSREEFERRMQRQFGRAPFNALGFFMPHAGKTAAQTVDWLADALLGRPLDPSQRALLIATLAPGAEPSAPLEATPVAEPRLRATVHLLLSMAEYQLC